MGLYFPLDILGALLKYFFARLWECSLLGTSEKLFLTCQSLWVDIENQKGYVVEYGIWT
jgi:hypothetical protein